MPLKFVSSQKGKPLLILSGYLYNLVHEGLVFTWRCTHYRFSACGGRVHTDSRSRTGKILDQSEHNHPPTVDAQVAHAAALKNVSTASAGATPRAPTRAMPRSRARHSSQLKPPSTDVNKLQLPDKHTHKDNLQTIFSDGITFEKKTKQKKHAQDRNTESDYEARIITQGDNLVEHITDDTLQSDCTSITMVKEENMDEYTTEDHFSEVYEQYPENNPISSNALLLSPSERVSTSVINIEEIEDEKQLRLIERREAIWQQREIHAKKMKIAEAEEQIVLLKLSSAKFLHNLELSSKG